MTEQSWRATRRQVHERANGCCEYCHTCEYNTAQPMHFEHIDPNGGDGLSNLCLACSSCNLTKGTATTALDPQTDEQVPLFNPRRQHWHEHFQWTDEGIRLEGKTAIGRATIIRLKMNHQRFIRARRNWIRADNHPPLEDR